MSRTTALLALLLTLGLTAWLLRGWYHLLGEPRSQPIVVIAVSTDAIVHYENSSAVATRGYMRANPHTGMWPIAYAIPLAILASLATVGPIRTLACARQRDGAVGG